MYTNYKWAIGEFTTEARLEEREILVHMSASDFARVSPGLPKPVKITTGSILFEVDNPAKVLRMMEAMHYGKAKFDPIEVVEYQIQHLSYYVLNDGNHRAAAAYSLSLPWIKAKIIEIIDLTYARILVDNKNRLCLFNEKNGFEITGLVLSELQTCIATTTGLMQYYDHIRSKLDEEKRN